MMYDRLLASVLFKKYDIIYKLAKCIQSHCENINIIKAGITKEYFLVTLCEGKS